MNLQPRFRQIVGQKEFLRNAVGVEHKTAGATLNSEAFLGADGFVTEAGYVKAGTAVYKGEDGFYLPWTDPTNGEKREGAGLTAHDVKITNGNAVVGVVIAGHPLERKCTGVTEAFKEEVKGYLRFDA